jgi:elongator complex protein 3
VCQILVVNISIHCKAVIFTMATATMTMRPATMARQAKLPPENERYLRACSDISNALIQDYESSRDSTKPKKDINLNKLRSQVAKKHSLSVLPPLTAIIAAVPEHYKKYILPKLIAKPIRMLIYTPCR